MRNKEKAIQYVNLNSSKMYHMYMFISYIVYIDILHFILAFPWIESMMLCILIFLQILFTRIHNL